MGLYWVPGHARVRRHILALIRSLDMLGYNETKLPADSQETVLFTNLSDLCRPWGGGGVLRQKQKKRGAEGKAWGFVLNFLWGLGRGGGGGGLSRQNIIKKDKMLGG